MLSTHEYGGYQSGGYRYDFPHPAVATDLAIFSLESERLILLLIERGEDPFRGQWALPGGFLKPDEDLDRCARRELLEETHLDVAFLKQFGIFSSPNRDPRQRVISVAYLALVPADRQLPVAGSDASGVRWCPIDALPELAFDHARIVETAIGALRAEVEGIDILLNLMPEEFTLSRLQGVYEAICGQTTDKRNFRARVLASGRIRATDRMERGPYRPAQLYERQD